MDSQALFDTLIDPTRRRILALLLAQGELCVCELTVALNEPQPKISRNLSVMKRSGLVVSRREGTWMHYRLAKLPPWTVDFFRPLTNGGVADFKHDMKRLKIVSGRAERCAN